MLKTGRAYIENAESFDDEMAKRVEAYQKFKDDTKKSFKLILYVCKSGTSDYQFESIGLQISKKHPNATIVTFDGYAMYSNKKIVGSSMTTKYDDKRGYIVTYKGGKEVGRALYSDYVKKNSL